MPKFYVISDTHGFYNEMREALDEAGFDPNDKSNFLIGLGDYLDRGRQPREVMEYLMSLERKVLIRGNHDNLILDCLRREYPLGHDWHNGTAQSIIDLAPNATMFDEACKAVHNDILNFTKNMVNYFETKSFVFCHGYVPYYTESWRTASQKDWNEAMWMNSYDKVRNGHALDKCVVAGHYHASYGRYMREGKSEFGPNADHSPFYLDDKLIMIDACTAVSGKVNVLVLGDEFLESDDV